MARTLGDVLHLFLDGAEPEDPRGAAAKTPPPGGEDPPPGGETPPEASVHLIACLPGADETLSAGIAWNLAAATAALGSATSWLQLTPELEVDPARLAHTLHLAAPGAASVAQCLRGMEGVHSRCPGGTMSLLIHGAVSAHEGRGAFERLAEAARHHLGRSPLPAGILGDELEIYRSIVTRRPVCLQAPDSRAAEALIEAARRLSEPADGV